MKTDDVKDLCLRYLDGDLSEQEGKDFSRLIAKSEEAARILASLSIHDSRFEVAITLANDYASEQGPLDYAMAAAGQTESLRKAPSDRPSLKDAASLLGFMLREACKTKAAKRLASAAAIVLVAFAVWQICGPASSPEGLNQGPFVEDAKPSHVATLTAEQDAVWEDRPGQDLHAGQRLSLIQGFAEIKTNRGAIATIQAPCNIEFLGDNRLSLTRGTLIGHCPTITSRGLTIDTPDAQAIDIGTRFGVAVAASTGTWLEVFAGEVTVAPIIDGQVGSAQSLQFAEAVQVIQGKVASVPASANNVGSRFAQAITFEKKQSSLAYRGNILRDPSMIACYGFDQTGGGVLRESRGKGLFDASIAGATWVQGRLPGTQALDFTGKGWQERVVLGQQASDRLSLHGAYTLSMWVNLRAMPADANWQPLATKGNDSWRLLVNRNRNTPQPQLGFYCSNDKQNPGQNYDALVTQDIALDRWHHIVITGLANDDGVTTRIYLDGELKGEKQFGDMLDSASRVAFGSAATNRDGFAFDGRLSEIAFFDRAIPQDEIALLYHLSAFPESTP